MLLAKMLPKSLTIKGHHISTKESFNTLVLMSRMTNLIYEDIKTPVELTLKNPKTLIRLTQILKCRIKCL